VSAATATSTRVAVRPLVTHAELEACIALQRETWGGPFSDRVPASILKVSQRVGGVAAGAFDERGALLGFVFGLTGVERGRIVHWSDMLAVRRESRGLGIGRMLKEHQRRTVRDLGGDVIYWTFDPLVARNAHMNVNVFGVGVVEYVENMYGITDSVLHGGIPTDRLVVSWPTGDEEVSARLARASRLRGDPSVLGAPIVTDGPATGEHCRIEIPSDAVTLLATDTDSARRWRDSVRAAMVGALAAGFTVDGFSIDAESARAWYLLTRAGTTSIRDR
jgi:predicted GNAT superfamily acetyltransferase